MKIIIRFKGGAGSGNHGHKGIPGHQGGSAPTGGAGDAGAVPGAANFKKTTSKSGRSTYNGRNGVQYAKVSQDAKGRWNVDYGITTKAGQVWSTENVRFDDAAKAFRYANYHLHGTEIFDPNTGKIHPESEGVSLKAVPAGYRVYMQNPTDGFGKGPIYSDLGNVKNRHVTVRQELGTGRWRVTLSDGWINNTHRYDTPEEAFTRGDRYLQGKGNTLGK